MGWRVSVGVDVGLSESGVFVEVGVSFGVLEAGVGSCWGVGVGSFKARSPQYRSTQYSQLKQM